MASIVIGVPLGIAATRYPAIESVVLGATGVIQTLLAGAIPAAVLALLIEGAFRLAERDALPPALAPLVAG